MHLKTLLHRVHPVKGFVSGTDELASDPRQPNGVRIKVPLRARRRSRGVC
jgi:hypothetical protein